MDLKEEEDQAGGKREIFKQFAVRPTWVELRAKGLSSNVVCDLVEMRAFPPQLHAPKRFLPAVTAVLPVSRGPIRGCSKRVLPCPLPLLLLLRTGLACSTTLSLSLSSDEMRRAGRRDDDDEDDDDRICIGSPTNPYRTLAPTTTWLIHSHL